MTPSVRTPNRGLGHAEVPVELRRGLLAQVDPVVLALEQHDRVAVAEDRVVDLLALLRADVGDELGDHLGRVEHVVPQHVVDERHHEGGLGRLLGLHVVDPLPDPARHLAQSVGQVHAFERLDHRMSAPSADRSRKS